MTREQARQALEKTWRFKQENGQIQLRELELIEQIMAGRAPVQHEALQASVARQFVEVSR